MPDLTLPTLYHWSPTGRREAIRVDGLKPYSPPSVTSPMDNVWAMGFGCICLGTTPARAWSLSGDMQHTSEIEEWDLWQAELTESDEVHIRAEFGPRIKEVRVMNPIPGDRLWWVGERR